MLKTDKIALRLLLAFVYLTGVAVVMWLLFIFAAYFSTSVLGLSGAFEEGTTLPATVTTYVVGVVLLVGWFGTGLWLVVKAVKTAFGKQFGDDATEKPKAKQKRES